LKPHLDAVFRPLFSQGCCDVVAKVGILGGAGGGWA